MAKTHYRDEEGKAVCRTWETDGMTFHQVVSHWMNTDELRETLEWCDANAKSLVNRANLQGVIDHKSLLSLTGFHTLLVFTHLNDAVLARLRWG